MSEIIESGVSTPVENQSVEGNPSDNNNTSVDTTNESTTYTQSEVEAMVARAITSAKKKWQERDVKTNAELSTELADLRSQLAKKENESYVSNEMSKRNLPGQLKELFYSDDEDESKAKLDAFSKWYSAAIEDAVNARLESTATPKFGSSTPNVKKAKTFLDYVAESNS